MYRLTVIDILSWQYTQTKHTKPFSLSFSLVCGLERRQSLCPYVFILRLWQWCRTEEYKWREEVTFPHRNEKNTVSNKEATEEAGETNMSENNWSTFEGLVLLQAWWVLLWSLWWKAEVPQQCATRSSSLWALTCLFHLTVSGISSKLREDTVNILWVWCCLVGPVAPVHCILEQIYQFIRLMFCFDTLGMSFSKMLIAQNKKNW